MADGLFAFDMCVCVRREWVFHAFLLIIFFFLVRGFKKLAEMKSQHFWNCQIPFRGLFTILEEGPPRGVGWMDRFRVSEESISAE